MTTANNEKAISILNRKTRALPGGRIEILAREMLEGQEVTLLVGRSIPPPDRLTDVEDEQA